MILSYTDALTYLYDNLPMFQRVGPAAIKKDLTNTLKLLEILGEPQDAFKSIHVAGTNGKGSTCHMLASVLQCAGYKTGLYTSPHLKDFTERIKVDGQEVSQKFVLDFVNRIRPAIEEIKPSFFEITVAMAFAYFAQQKVDIAVIEVGLGGRLDSTNVITPVVSLITNISWDHKDLLGNTLPDIAAEKAGIIKRGIPVVISERQEEVQHVFIEKAQKEGVEIFFASDEYSVALDLDENLLSIAKNGQLVEASIPFPLAGIYQKQNIGGVLKCIELLRHDYPVDLLQLRRGLEEVVVRTGLKGRWQVLSHNPTVVCDTAHNAGGVAEILRQISMKRFGRLFFVWGMVKDKDVSQILSLLPRDAFYYFCQANIPRAMNCTVLHQEAAKLGLKGEAIPDVNEARKTAVARADKHDFIYVGGSTYVVAEIEDL